MNLQDFLVSGIMNAVARHFIEPYIFNQMELNEVSIPHHPKDSDVLQYDGKRWKNIASDDDLYGEEPEWFYKYHWRGDFIKMFPIELSLYITEMIDDPRKIAMCRLVSKQWEIVFSDAVGHKKRIERMGRNYIATEAICAYRELGIPDDISMFGYDCFGLDDTFFKEFDECEGLDKLGGYDFFSRMVYIHVLYMRRLYSCRTIYENARRNKYFKTFVYPGVKFGKRYNTVIMGEKYVNIRFAYIMNGEEHLITDEFSICSILQSYFRDSYSDYLAITSRKSQKWISKALLHSPTPLSFGALCFGNFMISPDLPNGRIVLRSTVEAFCRKFLPKRHDLINISR